MITAFFENPDQMGIPHETVLQLVHEGISDVQDLADFQPDTIDKIAANLRNPATRVADTSDGAAAGATLALPPFIFSAMSQKKLTIAAELLRYYGLVGRPTTAANILWDPVIKDFQAQWEFMVEKKKKADAMKVPVITQELSIFKWTNSFEDFLHRMIGNNKFPLSYVIRKESAVPAIGVMAHGTPHSAEHETIEEELRVRASHTGSAFTKDNELVYYFLEEATRGTNYNASVKPFGYSRKKDGRAAWFALTKQYCGKDKWEAEIKKHEQVIHSRVWKGQHNFPLEKFIAQHRIAFVTLQSAAEHVTIQLPSEHSRVGYLLSAIQNSDAGLQAAMASIQTDLTKNGLRENFEDAASHLLPYDPVLKHRAAERTSKRGIGNISDATGEKANISAFGAKKGKGKTGVQFRYHQSSEYMKLSSEQREELKTWRASNSAKKNKNSNGHNQSNDQAIAAAVEKRVAKHLKGLEDEKTQGVQSEAYIMSLFKKFAEAKGGATVAAVSAKPPSLKSIMKKAKNQRKQE